MNRWPRAGIVPAALAGLLVGPIGVATTPAFCQQESNGESRWSGYLDFGVGIPDFVTLQLAILYRDAFGVQLAASGGSGPRPDMLVASAGGGLVLSLPVLEASRVGARSVLLKRAGAQVECTSDRLGPDSCINETGWALQTGVWGVTRLSEAWGLGVQLDYRRTSAVRRDDEGGYPDYREEVVYGEIVGGVLLRVQLW